MANGQDEFAKDESGPRPWKTLVLHDQIAGESLGFNGSLTLRAELIGQDFAAELDDGGYDARMLIAGTAQLEPGCRALDFADVARIANRLVDHLERDPIELAAASAVKHLTEGRTAGDGGDDNGRPLGPGDNAEKATRGDGTPPPEPPHTPLQIRILAALDGRALKKEALAMECKVGTSAIYRNGGVKDLVEQGRVVSDRAMGGYYRPDKPPNGGTETKTEPK